MHREANKWRQHVVSSCSLAFPLFSSHCLYNNLPHIFGSLTPTISNNSPPPVSPSLFNAYQGFIFAAGPRISLSQPLLGYCAPVMTATIWSVMRKVDDIQSQLHLYELLHQYSPIPSDLQPGGNTLFLPSPFRPSLSPVAS